MTTHLIATLRLLTKRWEQREAVWRQASAEVLEVLAALPAEPETPRPVSGLRDLQALSAILYDRPAGRNIIGHAIDTIERLRRAEPETPLLMCSKCHRYTTRLEADLRKFNTGRCADCGGGLVNEPWRVEPETPSLCPKCNGQCHVWMPPDLPGDQQEWAASTITSYPCRVCGGKGVLHAQQAEPETLTDSQVHRDLWIKAFDHPPTAECPDQECMVCGVRDCPEREPLHYHHDGCPCCSKRAEPETPKTCATLTREQAAERLTDAVFDRIVHDDGYLRGFTLARQVLLDALFHQPREASR